MSFDTLAHSRTVPITEAGELMFHLKTAASPTPVHRMVIRRFSGRYVAHLSHTGVETAVGAPQREQCGCESSHSCFRLRCRGSIHAIARGNIIPSIGTKKMSMPSGDSFAIRTPAKIDITTRPNRFGRQSQLRDQQKAANPCRCRFESPKPRRTRIRG